MKISKPIIEIRGTRVYCSAWVESKKGAEDLWFSVPQKHVDSITDRSDPFITALLIPAMSIGEDIYIEGDLSERLYFYLTKRIQALLNKVIPSLKNIHIYADSLVTESYNSQEIKGIATGFSGGVDSFCILAEYLYNCTDKNTKITHLFFYNVGSHGSGVRGRKLFRERYARLVPLAKKLNLPLLDIDSNLDYFYEACSKEIRHEKTRGIFAQTHTIRNAAVALLFQKKIRRFLFASAYQYSDLKVEPRDVISSIDMLILPMLSTEGCDLLSVGSEYNRIKKTQIIAQIADSHDFLDVCVNEKNSSSYTNCSECRKCMKTMIALDLVGYLNRYKKAFDIAKYYFQKEAFLCEISVENDPEDILSKEILVLCRELGIKLPSEKKWRRIPQLLKSAINKISS